MLVELGNAVPVNKEGEAIDLGGAPSVTYIMIPDHYTFDPSLDLNDFKQHLYESIAFQDGVTQRGDNEALIAVTHGGGIWSSHAKAKPAWVWSDNEEFAKVLGEFYGAPVGRPDDVEDTHHTNAGAPGQHPMVATPPAMMNLLVNTGRDIWARLQGGGVLGQVGTATATSTTSLTATGTPFSASALIGQAVVAGAAYGYVTANTTSVLTVDRWYNPATPGGAAATTPGATSTYVVMPGGPPALFVGLGNTNTAPSATDTTMSGEIVNGTPAGENNVIGTLPTGLLRQIAPYAHTAGTNTYTLTPVYTVNANESGILPQTVYRMNVSVSLVPGSAAAMMFETALSTSATLSAVGDQLTLTETVTGS